MWTWFWGLKITRCWIYRYNSPVSNLLSSCPVVRESACILIHALTYLMGTIILILLLYIWIELRLIKILLWTQELVFSASVCIWLSSTTYCGYSDQHILYLSNNFSLKFHQLFAKYKFKEKKSEKKKERKVKEGWSRWIGYI